MSFFLGSWGMNRSAEQTNRPRTLRGSRDLFVPRSDSFPMNPEKRHSFLNYFRLYFLSHHARRGQCGCLLPRPRFFKVTSLIAGLSAAIKVHSFKIKVICDMC